MNNDDVITELMRDYPPDRQISRLGRTDLTAAAFAAVMVSLEQDIAVHGWDQAHLLYAVHRVEATPEALGFAVVELPNPASRLNGPELRKYLRWLANRIDKMPSLTIPDVFGFVLVWEAWAVLTSKLPDSTYRAGDFSKRPDRIEIREVTAVDVSGCEYQLVNVRDRGRWLTTTKDETSFVQFGEMFSALQELVDKVNKVVVPTTP